jgi:16S rRNA G966 N2-methylase RsmD
VIIVSHDRYFLDNVVTKIIEIEDMTAKSYEGNYSFFVKEKEIQLQLQMEAFMDQQKKIKAMENTIEQLRETLKVEIYNMDYNQALKLFAKMNLKFDYIFLDPPFRFTVIEDILKFLLDNNMISENGNIICQYLKNNYIKKETDCLKIIKSYTHASSELTIYQYNTIENKTV